MDRVVRAAPATLVSRKHGGSHIRCRAGFVLPDVSATAMEDSLLFDRDAVSDRHHCYSELHISELSGVVPGIPSARRWLPALRVARTLENVRRPDCHRGSPGRTSANAPAPSFSSTLGCSGEAGSSGHEFGRGVLCYLVR